MVGRMNIALEILIIIILYRIIKELVHSDFAAMFIIFVIVIIVFVISGRTDQLTGSLSSVGIFLKNLPTSEFLNAIMQFVKNILNIK